MAEIKLEGLNARQRVLADIMWSIEEWTDVERFIATLPKAERLECRTLIQMMIMAFADEITEVDEAKTLLKEFTL